MLVSVWREETRFASDKTRPEYTIRLDAAAVPGEIFEKSRVELKGKAWHVAQRPICGSDEAGAEASGPIEMVVYAIWGLADPARTAEARTALFKEA